MQNPNLCAILKIYIFYVIDQSGSRSSTSRFRSRITPRKSCADESCVNYSHVSPRVWCHKVRQQDVEVSGILNAPLERKKKRKETGIYNAPYVSELIGLTAKSTTKYRARKQLPRRQHSWHRVGRFRCRSRRACKLVYTIGTHAQTHVPQTRSRDRECPHVYVYMCVCVQKYGGGVVYLRACTGYPAFPKRISLSFDFLNIVLNIV